MPLFLSVGANIEVETIAEKAFEVDGAALITSFNLFGVTINLSETIVVQWVVMLLLATLFFILGRNLKVIPTTRRQILAELIVGFFNGSVLETMGAKYAKYVCYIAALFFFSLLSSLMGLLGMRPPTADLSMLASWGLLTFFLVIYNKFKTGGFKGFLKSFAEPVPFMLPFNIIGEIANPLSQTLRHFGNIMGGFVIMGLIQYALSGIAFGIFQVGVPAVLSLYFDLFASTIQAYVFTLLTMAYVSMADCSSD
ncbi:MAG: F0F1 ATP synthase subunit A [Oscillospiraceae bacterium]|nr:F0F1 ATP synthase subunit A [Oscillospiraceae bacterium]